MGKGLVHVPRHTPATWTWESPGHTHGHRDIGVDEVTVPREPKSEQKRGPRMEPQETQAF